VSTMAGDEVLEVYRTHLSRNRALLFSVLGLEDPEHSALGSWVRAGDRDFLDLGSYAVFLLGHHHPAVLAAVRDQLDVLAGTSRSFPEPALATAASALAAAAPPGLVKTMLLNSGAEAVEAAIKLARVGTGRTPLVHLTGSFHGKTAGALSITAGAPHHAVGPLLPEVYAADRDDPEAAARLVRRVRPAAVFAEPVQGEGGIHPLSPELAAALRAACDETGALLVFDEIQCGLGRCGTLWAHEPLGVRPDVLLSGKALGGGVLPVSALLATRAAFAPYNRDALLHTSTFGGNPVAAAAAAATLTVVRADDVPGRCRSVGAALHQVLTDLAWDEPELVTAVTGRGAMLGLHCATPDLAGRLVQALAAERVLVTPCLSTPSAVRFTPSAYLSAADVEFTAVALRKAVARVRAAR
jgi:putrescine aminotransferase